jgi:hypothetical protein
MSKIISGWYYDLQLKNRLTCATLHPYSELVNGKWEKFKGKADDDIPEYREKPICRAIISEDFNVSVANTWSDFGGDMIGQMWESIKPLAPYASAAKEMIRSAVEEYDSADEATRNKINESTVSRTLANVMKAMNKTFNDKDSGLDITDYLNRALVVQGTRFSYYSGSGTSFGNLMMKFTIFPTYEGSKFKTVDEQVEKLLPYCIGKFVAGTEGIASDEERNQEGSVANLIDNMVSWQKPPGGFKANIKNVDVVQEGTLLLKFGAYYTIDNLVVENATFNFSKQMTKDPNGYITGTSIISPLYCDVTIQLRPATKYSDISLKKFVIGTNRVSSTIATLEGELRRNTNLGVDSEISNF